MNPLSPFTYHRRHKRSTLLLLTLITLATLGLYIMVAVLDSVTLAHADVSYLKRVSQVYPNIELSFEPGVVAQIRAHPGVAQVVQEKGLDISLPPIISEHHLFGVSETDVRALMDAGDLRLKEGRLPRPSTNEMALSEEMVSAMGIHTGDRIDRTVGRDWTGESWYDAIPAPLELVGILEGTGSGSSIRMGFVH